MKSESGVTLVALITIVVVLIIMMSIGIYSGINSYKEINFQKYKAQMRLIQNSVDELYEEYKKYSLENKDKNFFDNLMGFENYKIKHLQSMEVKEFLKKNNVNINENNILEGYYLFTSKKIEEEFKIKNIDISNAFIINFEKRYVFSIVPCKVVERNEEGNEREVEIYCLYQLDDEENLVEFKTDGNFEYIINKENYKQTIEITNNINIEKVEIDTGTGFVDINTNKNYYSEILGLGTRKVTIEILKDCEIKIIDVLGNSIQIKVILYNVPILEENMIPFIPSKVIDSSGTEKNVGVLCYQNSSEWYDYNVIEDIKFATAVVASNSSIEQYKEIISDRVRTTFEIKELEVNVWIPKNLINQINNTYGTVYKKEDFENSGMWVEAFWNGEKYVPVNGV